MSDIPGNAFITTKKGFCYLTVKVRRQNRHILKVRQYRIEAQEKRDLRRRYPNVTFDWKKISEQLANKRGVCRRYRARRQAESAPKRPREPFYGVVDPWSRTVYVNDPSNLAGVGALLDAMMARERAKESQCVGATEPCCIKRKTYGSYRLPEVKIHGIW